MANGGGAVYWRIRQLEKDVEEARQMNREAIQELQGKVDRLTMAIIGFAFTIAASGIAVVFFTGTA